MEYKEILENFKTPEGMNKIVEEMCETFAVIDNNRKNFTTPCTIDQLVQIKTELTQAVSTLNPIYSAAMSEKKIGEYHFYTEFKRQCEAGEILDADNKKVKFQDGATTVTAKDSVANQRRIRDILCGYIKAAEALIFDCKDRIPQNKTEYHNTDR